MNPRQTLAYWCLFALLGGYYWVVERHPTPKAEIEARREKVIPAFAEDVRRLTFHREGVTLVCERRDKRWVVIEPHGASAPADLVATLVETLTERQESDVMAASPKPEDLNTFGLVGDPTTFAFELKDGRSIVVKLGAKTPTRTAVYAQTSLSPRVLMVGLNVQYYGDLLYEAGKSAARKK